jgi:hypothetical protein
MGRPTKLSSEVCDLLVAAVVSGGSVTTAAQSLGLDPGTVSRWCTAGRRAWEAAGLEGQDPSDDELLAAVGPDQVFAVRLFRALQRAEVTPLIDAASSIVEAIEKGDWRAAMGYEKRRPRRPLSGSAVRPRVCRQGPRAPGGRPSKLTASVRAELADLAARGVYVTHAAAVVGISEATYHRWMRRGEDVYETTCMLLDERYAAEGDDHAYATPAGVLAELEESRPDEVPYVQLYLDVSLAESNLSMRARAVWREGARRDWRASKEMLAWDYPERWGPDAKPQSTLATMMRRFDSESAGPPAEEGSLEDAVRDVLEALRELDGKDADGPIGESG